MRRKVRNRLILPLVFLLAGCGIGREVYWGAWGPWESGKDKDQKEVRKLIVSSEPDNATVYVDGVFMGQTPLSINVEHLVQLEERKRNKYQRVTSNSTFSFLMFGKGPKPGSTSLIGSQAETRPVMKEAYHHLEIRKKGYVTDAKTIGLDDHSVFFSLQKKLCIYFADFRVENSIRLSVSEWLHDLMLRNKFSREVTPERLKRAFIKDQRYINMFEVSKERKGCYVLSCFLIIENDYSTLNTKLIDPDEILVLNDSDSFGTGIETEAFIDNLESAIASESAKIYRMLKK